MNDAAELEKQIQRLKAALAEKRAKAEDLESLVGERVEVELWGLGEKALEKAAWDSFFYLDRTTASREEPPLTSPRRVVGPLLVLAKKTWRALFRPYTRMIFERQNRLNREFVRLELANLLRLEKMRQRLDALEKPGGAEPEKKE